MTYLCIVDDGYWGRGDTAKKAKSNAAAESGQKGPLKRYLLYECSDPNVRLNGLGFIVHHLDATLILREMVPSGLELRQ